MKLPVRKFQNITDTQTDTLQRDGISESEKEREGERGRRGGGR